LDLPALTVEECACLDRMRTYLGARIADAGGALPFDRYMDAALYAPGLGYYVNGRRRFGADGDFVTAPEISPLFGACVANQVAECLAGVGAGAAVLEVGAGSGRLAADLLQGLERQGALPAAYRILELSPDLRQAQREALQAAVPHLLDRVTWLDALPAAPFSGVVIGNELLDAMPVHRFRRHHGDWQELCVAADGEGLGDRWVQVASPGLAGRLAQIWPDPAPVADGYRSEVNLRLGPWLNAIAGNLARGVVLLLDYGYTRREYYHPERAQGTLICHFRHRAYADPYLLPGLQDITANVDFSAVAGAAVDAGLAVAGFTTQAFFLIDNGLDALLAASEPGAVSRHLDLVQGAKRLTLPSEMGERFKVIALARGIDAELRGFRSRDLRDRL
jgi:SAM-dependent MidA family methyltransferase